MRVIRDNPDVTIDASGNEWAIDGRLCCRCEATRWIGCTRMEVFAAVAETGSFAGAARQLRLSPAAVTRAVAALEERLGVRLLNRTTRSLEPDRAGLGFLASVRRVLADLDEAERVAAGATGTPAAGICG